MANNEALLASINGLRDLINTKFTETHNRLDKINGRVDKHENIINEALIERSKNREEQKALIPNHIMTCPNAIIMKNVGAEVANCKNQLENIQKDLVKVDADLKEANEV